MILTATNACTLSELLLLLNPSLASGGSGGTPINHICLSMSAADFTALTARLTEQGVDLTPGGERSFGARGYARQSVYFRDPDGNILEIRHYG